MTQRAYLRPGETCWRVALAPQLKFLVDYQAYFEALRPALEGARRSIHILGWSFDPRTPLDPDAVMRGAASHEIGRLLVRLAETNPDLDVRILIWRSALAIAASQHFFPHRAKGWFRGTPVKFRLDAATPFGACHHQKAVIIDGALAFVGGGDFGLDRWDSDTHRDPSAVRRHPPRHEVMAMVDGEAAATLEELFCSRWERATGQTAAPTFEPFQSPPWPSQAASDLAGAQVAIARTVPAWRKARPVAEISRLTLEAIAGARELIYLENQYFTWPAAVEALAARLAEPQGPQIVAMLNWRSPSYFDRLTMDCARSVAIWRLRAADTFGRFFAFAPVTSGGRPIVVHAKLMVVDDHLARISSANLNNRSEGFDTECELALEADGGQAAQAIASFRDRLAAHWIGRSASDLAEARRTLGGGFAQALQALDGEGRLRRLEPQRLGPIGEFIAAFHIGDPRQVGDSWRPWRRRARLQAEARKARETISQRA
jgi:phosphatidylserine/phosphatidylglycerophosphate/cardiolipin synthase-like enzyme